MNLDVLYALFEFAGRRAWSLAWPMAWQVTLLVLALLTIEGLLRRRLRPAFRHALWLLVPIKLLLPPSLALPMAPAYWLVSGKPATPIFGGAQPDPSPSGVEVTFYPSPVLAIATHESPTLPQATLAQRLPGMFPGLFLTGWVIGSLVLLGTLIRRTLVLQRLRRESTEAPEGLQDEAAAVAEQLGCRRPLEIRLVEDGTSPALLGLRRPTILLPRSLSEVLQPDQRRAVLLHEIAHARRGDLAVHALQTLLLLAWWWNPFVWVANARLRAAREECVDDTVAWELGSEAETYPATLLAVARATLERPRLALGFIGILESRSALRRRIQRLLDQPSPARPGLGWFARIAFVAAAFILLPMAPRPGMASTSPPRPAESQPEPPTVRGDVYTVAPAPAEERLRRLSAKSLFEPSSTLPSPTTTTQLVLRVGLPQFVDALERSAGRPLGNDFAAWQEALYAHLKETGFDPGPPHRVEWDLRRNAITVAGPVDQVERARRTLDQLGRLPDQLVLESRFFRLTEPDAKAIRLWRFEPGPAPDPVAGSGPSVVTLDLKPPTVFVDPLRTNMLDPAAFKALLDEIARRPGVKVLAGPRVTTLAGRAASVTSGDATDGSPSYTVEIEPGQVDPEGRIPLAVRAHVSEVLSVTPRLPAPNATNEGGTTVARGTVAYLDRHMTNAAVLPDTHSLVLTDASNLPPPPGAGRLLVLVTVTRIDAAGNPVQARPSGR